MQARTFDDIRRISDSLKRVKRLSDGLIKVGPISLIGIDGLLAWLPIPGLNTLYSVAVGGFILWQGLRAKVSTGTLIIAGIAILADSGISVFDYVIPFIPAGSILDTLFQGHLYAVMLITRAIETTHYVVGTDEAAVEDAAHKAHKVEMKALKKKRVVYIGG